MSSYQHELSSINEFNETPSTFLYQVNEAPSELSILDDEFLLLNELKTETYLAFPTPKNSSTLLTTTQNSNTANPVLDILNSYSGHQQKSLKMERLADCSNFSGYSQDNAQKFLSEFQSYALLHDLYDHDPKKIAAFHLHLKGPALTWFNTLSDRSKQSWRAIKVLFEEKFVNFNNTSSMAMMEGQIFNSLKLTPGQKLEDFHSLLVEKGHLLQKPNHEILCRFIDGLPDKMAFFVRAGQPADLTSALTAAKMAEACGYRDIHPTNSANVAMVDTKITSTTGKPSVTVSETPTDFSNLTAEITKLTKTVSDLAINSARNTNNGQQRMNYRRSNESATEQPTTPNSLTCYSCNYTGHRKRECNWDGTGSPNPARCQLCRQYGHPAFRCKTRNQGNSQVPGENNAARPGFRK